MTDLAVLEQETREQLGEIPEELFWHSPRGDVFVCVEPPQVKNLYVQKRDRTRTTMLVPFPWTYYIAEYNFNSFHTGSVLWSQVPITDFDQPVYHTLLTNVKENDHYCEGNVNVPHNNGMEGRAVAGLEYTAHVMAGAFNGGSYMYANKLLPAWTKDWLERFDNGNGWHGWICPEKYFAAWERLTVHDILHRDLVQAGTLRQKIGNRYFQ